MKQKIFEAELISGVNIRIRKRLISKREKKRPYFLEWTVPGSRGWTRIDKYSTFEEAMQCVATISQDADKIDFRVAQD